MAKNDRTTKIITYILYLVLIAIIIILSYLLIKYYNLCNLELTTKNNLNQELLISTNSYNEKTNNNQTIINEITELNNIDNNIAKAKQEVFSLASILEQKIINKESNKKIAYLTFDDGPYYNTHKFLEVLNKYEVKATFFTIGLNKQKCYDNKKEDCYSLYKKITDNGHTIANHTYSHLIFNGLYSSTSSLMKQIKKQEELIKEKTNVTTNIFRFPGGSATAKSYKVFNSSVEELRKNNYGWVDWTAGDGDGGSLPNASVAMKNFKSSIDEDIEVVLFHDYNNITLSILPEAIEYLKANNYIILPLFYESVKVNK